MPEQPTLTTPRLTLEPLDPSHADALFDVFRDPETLTYWHTLPHRTPRDTQAMIAQNLRDSGSPWWAITQTSTGRVIGMVGFLLGALVPGMGYIVHRDVWRQGFGSEAVRAAVDYGFATLALSRVELWIHHGNLASQRLAQAVGFRQRGQFMQASAHLGRYETLVYGLRAAEWTPGTSRWETAFSGIYPIIPTPDVAASVAFYRDQLGFRVSYFAQQYAIVARGEWTSERAEIHFERQTAPSTPAARLRLPVGPHIALLFDELRNRGVPIATPLIQQPWGREFEVVDPNGWRLVFMGVD